jgi:hypothetical protein
MDRIVVIDLNRLAADVEYPGWAAKPHIGAGLAKNPIEHALLWDRCLAEPFGVGAKIVLSPPLSRLARQVRDLGGGVCSGRRADGWGWVGASGWEAWRYGRTAIVGRTESGPVCRGETAASRLQ